MFHYFPTTQKMSDEDLGTYTTYGVTVQDDEKKTILSISDVSPNKQFVIELCERCNQFQLDPIHLSDLIYDLLD